MPAPDLDPNGESPIPEPSPDLDPNGESPSADGNDPNPDLDPNGESPSADPNPDLDPNGESPLPVPSTGGGDFPVPSTGGGDLPVPSTGGGDLPTLPTFSVLGETVIGTAPTAVTVEFSATVDGFGIATGMSSHELDDIER